MNKSRLYLTIALFIAILVGVPLIIGIKLGQLIAQAWFGFSFF